MKIITNRLFQWIIFAGLGLLAFYPIFSFWFYHGWETSWLLGITGGDFSLINLMRSHGLISYLNYSLFGWRPAGWFVTALLFHIITAMTVNLFVSRKTNKTVGLIAGLLFLVTTAHHDVITWGSFESLYAVQTLCFYLAIWSFDIYRQTKKQAWYAVMIFSFFVSLVIRESGLLLLPLVFLYDVFMYGQIFKKRSMVQWVKWSGTMIRSHVVLWIIGVAYLFMRASYGGSGHDFIDERVQFRILLFNEHRYIEYIQYGLLSFGYFIGPYLIPYPLLNIFRDIVLHYITAPFVRIYFFTAIGWMVYASFLYIVWVNRKKKYSNYLWFCFLAFTAVTVFYSFAWTVKDSFLATAYSWSENRWRYLGFTFFAAGVGIIMQNWIKRRFLGISLLVLYLLVNTLMLHAIERGMYRDNSKPAVMFYKTFLKTFPTLTPEDRFYEFRASAGLNDYMAELSFIYPSYYPNIKELPALWVRSEMYYILQGLKNGTAWASHVHFIDYTQDRGVRDHTQKVLSILSALKPLDLSFSPGTDSAILIQTPGSFPVEFRYHLTVQYTASPGPDNFPSAVRDIGKARALSLFSAKLSEMISDTHVSVCQTMGDEHEPYYDVRKELALDGNLSNRSYWWANCRPAWIVLDMGSQVTFAGGAWASLSIPDAVPRDYHYDVSDDGKMWKQIMTVKGNQKKSNVDVFTQEVRGRYIRLWVDETEYRQMLLINEFVPLVPETLGIADYYDDLTAIYTDVQANWMKIVWTTLPDNTVPEADRTIYVPVIEDGATHQIHVEIPDSDFYSALGQFLNRSLQSLEFTPPKDVLMQFGNIRLDSLQTYPNEVDLP